MKSAYVVYCRKSSESDDRQAASIQEQVSILKRFAAEHGLSVVKRFTESKSAKAPRVRKEFEAMLEFITSRNDIKGIIT
ncbi:MAG: Recombinase, partial [Candidatus Gottesmanbacteria bacterium GW2011_GWA2_47_9]